MNEKVIAAKNQTYEKYGIRIANNDNEW